MNYINLTPHDVTVIFPDGTTRVFLRGGNGGVVPRVGECEPADYGELDGIPRRGVRYGEVKDVPALEAGTFLIVSQMVATRLPSRLDLLFPTDLVRDDVGRVIGCRAWGQI